MTTSRQKSLRTHPSFSLILADLQAGNDTIVTVAKRYEVNPGSLKSWWHSNRDNYVAATLPALDEAQATVLVEKLADTEAKLLDMTAKFGDVAELFEALKHGLKLFFAVVLIPHRHQLGAEGVAP